MTTTPAEETVAAALATLSYGTLGSTIFYGPESVVAASGDKFGSPAECIFVMDAGGPAPAPFLDGSTSEWEEVVQIIKRGPHNEWEATKADALEMMHSLQRYALTGYYFCLVTQPNPTYLGQTDTGLHRFSFNVRVKRAVA